MRAVVCTYSRHDLAQMAADSIRRHATGISGVTIMDGSGTLPLGGGVVHATFRKFFGAYAAMRMFPGEDLLCVDDDVVLLGPVDAGRYTARVSKPVNGHMVFVFRPGGEGAEALPYDRIRRPSQIPGVTWAEEAAQQQCELIDNLWLHIDKGSQGDIPQREELIRAIQRGGPGTELKALLKTIGIVASPTCSCNKRARIMDQRGCDWCEENIDEIDRWLAEEAKKRKLPYLSLAGKALIRLAIRRARKKGNSR